MVLNGDLLVENPSMLELIRMSELMEKYSDHPMDFADASLAALAESLNTNRIFTLDNDFHIYRFHGKQPFEVAP